MASEQVKAAEVQEAMGRPDCFEFAMDFLGGTDAEKVRAYVEHLEQSTRLRGGVPEAVALRAAVAAIYFADSADYLRALWEVVRALDPKVAAMLEDDEKAAFDYADAQLTAAPQAPAAAMEGLSEAKNHGEWLKRVALFARMIAEHPDFESGVINDVATAIESEADQLRQILAAQKPAAALDAGVVRDAVPQEWFNLLAEARNEAYDKEGYVMAPSLASAVEDVDDMLAAMSAQAGKGGA